MSQEIRHLEMDATEKKNERYNKQRIPLKNGLNSLKVASLGETTVKTYMPVGYAKTIHNRRARRPDAPERQKKMALITFLRTMQNHNAKTIRSMTHVCAACHSNLELWPPEWLKDGTDPGKHVKTCAGILDQTLWKR